MIEYRVCDGNWSCHYGASPRYLGLRIFVCRGDDVDCGEKRENVLPRGIKTVGYCVRYTVHLHVHKPCPQHTTAVS